MVDTDIALLTLALGTLAYGIYTKSSKSAGYNETPPPKQQPKPKRTAYLPGIPVSVYDACEKAVDSPGAVLAGPVAPKGIEPDRLKELVNIVVKRIQLEDVMCTAIDGASCVADAEGSEYYDVTCMVYVKSSNMAVQLNVGVLALDDGRILVTKMTPASQVTSHLLEHDSPFKLDPTPYSMPIDDV